MKPTDPVGKRKLKHLHVLFAALGPDATEAVRDGIERATGQRSTKGLTEAQAWSWIDALCRQLGRSNPEPICVDWCAGYQRGRLPRGQLDLTTALPSQAQIWGLYKYFLAAGIHDPRAWLARRYPRQLPDGVIRTAEQAWWVTKGTRRSGEHRQDSRRRARHAQHPPATPRRAARG